MRSFVHFCRLAHLKLRSVLLVMIKATLCGGRRLKLLLYISSIFYTEICRIFITLKVISLPLVFKEKYISFNVSCFLPHNLYSLKDQRYWSLYVYNMAAWTFSFKSMMSTPQGFFFKVIHPTTLLVKECIQVITKKQQYYVVLEFFYPPCSFYMCFAHGELFLVYFLLWIHRMNEKGYVWSGKF